MTLIMFDIDGTLTTSFHLDAQAFLDALGEEFGFRDVSDDWASYRHVTDTGIMDEVFRGRLGRPPSPEETARMQGRFMALLTARVHAAGGIAAMPGAAAILARLAASPEYVVSYASGGWRASALFKLRSAGLPTGTIPGAFSDDDLSREGICRVSRQRAETACGHAVERVVYVGDGVWDVRTSRRLGYGFIGVGSGEDAAKLRAEGAECVLPDFLDIDAFSRRVQTSRFD